ncbi:hypothetical protein CYMTET_24090 [Cymbomonas tetramitiformis]|uniref:Transcription factor TFIIIC triple barrel domain-containing protein n=1 Tax=Cymbomonas tetramitiformis TaxID=36881 RepID=A0AAE0F1P3_9CHLO|nr:hypothetical protein CYMTET_43402 [Cymbomonas tetramitiformis]KAK3267342.1 hypothetical protein CYMTET_24090 [Cymbomonas tetramitiformis]
MATQRSSPDIAHIETRKEARVEGDQFIARPDAGQASQAGLEDSCAARDLEQDDSESEYVLLDLGPAAFDVEDGSTFHLSGLDTGKPVLRLNGTTMMVGEYQDTVGSTVLFNEEEVPSNQGGVKRKVQYIGTSEKVLKFRRVRGVEGDSNKVAEVPSKT